MSIETKATAPRWFAAAIEQLPEHRDIEVSGVSIHLRCWGRPGAPGIVLVHGGSAHSGWWDHIAPLLSKSFRVVALDLSGHGDSAWRAHYPMETWAIEVLAAARAARINGRPYVVGHSMGGWVALTAGALLGEYVAGLVIVDTPIFDEPPEQSVKLATRHSQPHYKTRTEICDRFRTVPTQDVVLPYVSQHVAEESVRKTESGWVWKFDPEIDKKCRGSGERVSSPGLLRRINSPTLYVRCEFGMVDPGMAEQVSDLFEQRPVIVELADAGHHPMMDNPLPLTSMLLTTLEIWRRS